MTEFRANRAPWPLPLACLVGAALWGAAVAAPHRTKVLDLTQDHLSAQALRNGGSVYDPLPSWWALPGKTDAQVNDHPPPYILALFPLGLVPYPLAFVLLGAANTVAGVAACAIVGRELGWPARVRLVAALVILLHPATITCLRFGNVSLLLLLLVTLGWRAFRRHRTGAAGAWIGLAAGIKLFPGLLLVGLVGARAWRGAVIGAATVLACWAVSALVVGPDDVMTYARVRAPANARTYLGHPLNLSVTAVAHRAFGLPNELAPWVDRIAVRPRLAEALAWAGRAGVGLLVVIGLWRARRCPDYPDRALAVLVPGMLLLSPLTWLHAVAIMFLPVALLGRSSTGARRTALIAAAVAMCVFDYELAVRWVTITGQNVPWAVNLVMLAPTGGVLGALALAAFAPREREPVAVTTSSVPSP